MRIAICDDDRVFSEIFEKYVKISVGKYFTNVCIYKYTNGTVLLDRHRSAPFDLIFLGIDMPVMSGFEVAEQLKKISPSSRFVFITGHSELVFQSFDFQPFNFIQKGDKEEMIRKIERVAFQLMREMKQSRRVILEDKNYGRYAVYLKDIKYIESSGHYVKYYIDKKEFPIKLRGSISELKERYAAADFIHIHRRYLVNLDHIFNVDITNGAVILDQGERLPLSRALKDIVSERYTRYLRSMS